MKPTMTNGSDEMYLSQILNVLIAMRNGDFSVNMPSNLIGLEGKIADTLNEVLATKKTFTASVIKTCKTVGKEGEFLKTAQSINAAIDQLNDFTNEVTSVVAKVGKEEKTGGLAKSKNLYGGWKELTAIVKRTFKHITVTEDKYDGTDLGLSISRKIFSDMTDFVEPPKKLLIIENNALERNELVRFIGNGDVVTKVVSTFEAGLKALKKEKFDCILLDLVLPGMDGFEFLEEFKKDWENASTPVIVLTGKESNL